MKQSIREELTDYINEEVKNYTIYESIEDLHYHLFNEDYYLIGYYNCSEWLKTHNLGEFEAAAICTQYELDNFGELGKPYDNSESVVNMLAYIYGEELMNEMNFKK